MSLVFTPWCLLLRTQHSKAVNTFWSSQFFIFSSQFHFSEIILLNLKGSIMALGLLLGIGRAFRRKRASSLDILSSKRGPRDYYKGKNCKPTGFHTRKGGYVVVQEKLPNYVVPDLTDFKLKPYVAQCAVEGQTSGAANAAAK
ncbi:39S ribosomal protein L41-A, mitochondrial [Heracleum sosnowskyi]|uniref:39S ribosomal protein L41-A, mitochondrial n=1 Tax=Heracleum sosnowskyi TaxID=360622 RepID=A0AAD8IEC6_9APIA|nr:39S ribosomal protein L41-A, mitochondrial [Heracleum sosnowskyi]